MTPATTGNANIPEATIQEFKSRLRGELIRPGDRDYETARMVYNAMIDRHPLMVLRSADVADVIAAVNFARENTLPVAIRGGGHNVTGAATSEGGIVIDLSLMKG